MAIPLGTYDSEGTLRGRLRFERARKTSLGVASGVVSSGLENSRQAIDRIRSQFARQDRREGRGYIPPESLQTGEVIGQRPFAPEGLPRYAPETPPLSQFLEEANLRARQQRPYTVERVPTPPSEAV